MTVYEIQNTGKAARYGQRSLDEDFGLHVSDEDGAQLYVATFSSPAERVAYARSHSIEITF